MNNATDPLGRGWLEYDSEPVISCPDTDDDCVVGEADAPVGRPELDHPTMTLSPLPSSACDLTRTAEPQPEHTPLTLLVGLR
ncbi:hypothetical protein [Nocardia takedensis]|uniref:hypothetical protein n=1 Tax=Nocardia takedensis TaxID=259390 RepID=UPI0012F64C4E|nr:hypothetical protein [Nocardia takedensis]